MRSAIQNVATRQPPVPQHLGLAYDMWAPVDADGDQAGKANDQRRLSWLQTLETLSIADDYDISFRRWQASLHALGAFALPVRAATRLLIGHGNPSGTEVGLTVQHTWGAPIIPASSLKGVLQHHLADKYGPDPGQWHNHPLDSTHPQRTHAAFQPAYWNDRVIKHSPGRAIRAIFGAPQADSDNDWPNQEDVGAMKGEVVFHDAWWFCREKLRQPFAVDLLNVHQRRYYGQTGDRVWPNDYDSPVPIHFMTVRPGQRFLIAVSGEETLAQWVLRELAEALCERGIGGKTSAGYGMFQPDGSIIKPQREVPTAPELNRLLNLLSGKALPAGLGPESTQRERFEFIRQHWLDALLRLSLEQRQKAAAELRKSRFGKHPKLAEDVKKIARRLVPSVD